MTVYDYLAVLRRSAWLIALTVVLGLAAGFLATALVAPTYSARATIYVAVTGSTTPGDLQQGNVFAVQRAQTYASLATTPTVLTRASRTLGGDVDLDALQHAITASARQDTSLIDVVASGSDAQSVADDANAVAKALIAEAITLDAPADPLIRLSVVEEAVTPIAPVSPKLRNTLLIGLVIGLALGIAIAVTRGLLDTRIRSLRDMKRAPGIATLTAIPRSQRGRGDRLEGFRLLRAHLMLGTDSGRSIAVASVSAATDAHGVASDLAATYVEIGRSVVVVDARLSVGQSDQPGLVDVIENRAGVDDAVQRGEGVAALSTGSVEPGSAQTLGSQEMRDVLAQLLTRFDMVIVACPSLISDSSATVVASAVDSALVVIEAGTTTAADYRLALERLKDVGVKNTSVVLDQVAPRDTEAGRGIAGAGNPSELTA